MKTIGEASLYATQLDVAAGSTIVRNRNGHPGCRAVVDRLRRARRYYRRSRTDGERTEVRKGRNAGASGKTTRQLPNSGGSRTEGASTSYGARRVDLIVKTAEDKNLVLQKRTTDGSTGEFLVETWWFGNSLEIFFDVRKARQNRVGFISKYSSVPMIGAVLGHYIDHRP